MTKYILLNGSQSLLGNLGRFEGQCGDDVKEMAALIANKVRVDDHDNGNGGDGDGNGNEK